MGAFKKFKELVKLRKKQLPEQVAAAQAGTSSAGGNAVQFDVPQAINPLEPDEDQQTEAGRKKAKAGGKRTLSVARSSGGGINI